MNEKIKKYLPGGGFIYLLVFCAAVFFMYRWVSTPVRTGKPGAAKKNTAKSSPFTKKGIVFKSPIVRLEKFLNFGDLEGPYPQKQLPKFRWGLGPDSTLVFRSPAEQPAVLVLNACNFLHDRQEVKVFCNDEPVGDAAFDKRKRGEFSEIHLPLQLRKGQNTLRLKYSRWSAENTNRRKLALLFSGIKIRKK